MEPIIRATLENLLGKVEADNIDVIANEVEYKEDGSWTIKFRHPERLVNDFNRFVIVKLVDF